jgi:hypothetical protein
MPRASFRARLSVASFGWSHKSPPANRGDRFFLLMNHTFQPGVSHLSYTISTANHGHWPLRAGRWFGRDHRFPE